ncbi:hypothetical protein [Caproiciproducens galactitolivorans]|uniref:hypothetical protein n=1 Tax=Caproiciproducens galactitolivorans TaxID=642589 RepID=UPI0024092100|nr:hypothetical protein [Caproiciproducens galactitolivorans]
MLEKSTSKRIANWEAVIKCLNGVDSANSNITELVDRAVLKRLSKDLSKQIQETEKDKRKRNINDFCRMIESQTESVIYLPLSQFVDQFNIKYSGNRMQIYRHTQTTQNILGEEIHIQIELPSEETVIIEIQTVLEENYVREIHSLPPYNNYTFHDYSSKCEHYIPQCNARNIMAWGRIADTEKKGFNILLLENKNDIYGEWFLLFNRNSALSRENRVEPFGFEFNELPEQIQEIGMLSKYSSELIPFDINKIIDFISERI